jgi:hypothetical protein
VDIGADEVAPVLADGSRGPSLLEEPLIRLYAWVQMDGRVGRADSFAADRRFGQNVLTVCPVGQIGAEFSG